MIKIQNLTESVNELRKKINYVSQKVKNRLILK